MWKSTAFVGQHAIWTRATTTPTVRLVGTYPNQIFLPFVGRRHFNGTVEQVDEAGTFWGSWRRGTLTAAGFVFVSSGNIALVPTEAVDPVGFQIGSVTFPANPPFYNVFFEGFDPGRGFPRRCVRID